MRPHRRPHRLERQGAGPRRDRLQAARRVDPRRFGAPDDAVDGETLELDAAGRPAAARADVSWAGGSGLDLSRAMLRQPVAHEPPLDADRVVIVDGEKRLV